jgi:hypothetical protein
MKRSMPPRKAFSCLSELIICDMGQFRSIFMRKRRDTNLLKEWSAGLNLGGNLLCEESLSQDLKSLVLGLDTEFLSLLIDLDIVDTLTSLTLRNDPGSQLLVWVLLSSFFILLIGQGGGLELLSNLFGASSNGLLRHIDSPVIIILDFSIGESLGLGGDLLGEFVIGASVQLLIAILRTSLLAVVAATLLFLLLSISLGVSISLALSGLLAILSSLLCIVWRVLQDVTGKSLAHVERGALTARFAVTDDVVVLGDLQNGFRVLALLAKNKLLNETVEVVLKLGGLMSTVNDPTVIGWVGLDLRSQLETEVFDDI